MAGHKRKIDIIDLTGSDENADGNLSKTYKPTNAPAGSRRRPPLPSPPTSSQPYSSQSKYSAPSTSQGGYGYTPAFSQTHSQADRNSWLASAQENEDDIRREINLEGNEASSLVLVLGC
jgi:hypothetical protein